MSIPSSLEIQIEKAYVIEVRKEEIHGRDTSVSDNRDNTENNDKNLHRDL
jgi:hypothetical protein